MNARNELAETIPYDEMRGLCGLDPAVKAYVARRELARMATQMGEVLNRIGKAWSELIEQMLPAVRAINEASKPKQAPPFWAVNPGRTRRNAFGATRRVK